MGLSQEESLSEENAGKKMREEQRKWEREPAKLKDTSKSQVETAVGCSV